MMWFPVAALNLITSSAGIRPRSLTSMPCALAHARTSVVLGPVAGALRPLRPCGVSDLTRANRLVTCFEPLGDVAGGVGEFGVEGEALAVDLNGR